MSLATLLLDAASEGNHKEVLLALQNGAAIDAQKENGWSALHLAVWHGRDEMARLLVAAGADVNLRDNHGETPLHCVAHCGDFEMLRLLKEAGADINATCNLGRTPLHVAILAEYFLLTVAIIRAGAVFTDIPLDPSNITAEKREWLGQVRDAFDAVRLNDRATLFQVWLSMGAIHRSVFDKDVMDAISQCTSSELAALFVARKLPEEVQIALDARRYELVAQQEVGLPKAGGSPVNVL